MQSGKNYSRRSQVPLQVENLQVENLQVENLQVENLQVENLQVGTLQVGTLQVGTLQVGTLQVVLASKLFFHAIICERPIPCECRLDVFNFIF